jgi:hypothetical protein
MQAARENSLIPGGTVDFMIENRRNLLYNERNNTAGGFHYGTTESCHSGTAGAVGTADVELRPAA